MAPVRMVSTWMATLLAASRFDHPSLRPWMAAKHPGYGTVRATFGLSCQRLCPRFWPFATVSLLIPMDSVPSHDKTIGRLDVAAA
jgi:hypothetical protein